MGYYLQTPGRNHEKAAALVARYGGHEISSPPASLAELPEDTALVCVVDNGPFEAAALAYCDEEMREFAAERFKADPRPTQWVVLNNKEQVYKDAGFP